MAGFLHCLIRDAQVCGDCVKGNAVTPRAFDQFRFIFTNDGLLDSPAKEGDGKIVVKILLFYLVVINWEAGRWDIVTCHPSLFGARLGQRLGEDELNSLPFDQPTRRT